MGEAQIGQLFPPGWNIAVVAEFSKAIIKTKQDEIDKNQTISQTFIVNVGGMGDGKNKTIKVDKNWTYQRFLEVLYEAEIGKLPLDPIQRENKMKEFNVVGSKVPKSKHDKQTKTLEELCWNGGISVHATYTAQIHSVYNNMSDKKTVAYEKIFDMTKWGDKEWKSFFKYKKLGNQKKMFKNTYGGKTAKEKFKETWTKIKSEGLNGLDMVKLVENATNLKALGIDPIIAVKIEAGVKIQKQEFHKQTQPKAPSNDDWFTNEFTIKLDLGRANSKTITVQPHWTVNDLFVDIRDRIVGQNDFCLLIGCKRYRMNDNKHQLNKQLKDVKGIDKKNRVITVVMRTTGGGKFNK